MRVGFLLTAFSVPAIAGDFEQSLTPPLQPADDGWELTATINGWLPGITGTSASGIPIDVGLDDIIRDLNMVFMGSFHASKGRWGLGMDLVYLDLETTGSRSLGPASLSADITLKSWIVTPVVSYCVLEREWGQFKLLAGARYLYLKENTDLQVTTPKCSKQTRVTLKGDEWAAIVGFKGFVNLSERWYMPYYFDIGAGQPDLTLQAFAGVAYRFNGWDMSFGYRYLKWDLADSSALSDLEVKGPMIGARFDF